MVAKSVSSLSFSKIMIPCRKHEKKSVQRLNVYAVYTDYTSFKIFEKHSNTYTVIIQVVVSYDVYVGWKRKNRENKSPRYVTITFPVCAFPPPSPPPFFFYQVKKGKKNKAKGAGGSGRGKGTLKFLKNNCFYGVSARECFNGRKCTFFSHEGGRGGGYSRPLASHCVHNDLWSF